MKLNVDFSALWAEANKIAKTKVGIDLKASGDKVPLINTTAGVEINIDDVEFAPVATWKKQHVLLFIPDHSYNYDEVMLNPRERGNKYHLTDCQKLEEMRYKGRFKRYHATNNLSGKFKISGGEGRSQDVELSVCKLCLSKLDYKNYNQNRAKVFAEFNLAEFFKYYSSQFRETPNAVKEPSGSYAENWRIISTRYREYRQWCCESCGVNLRQHPHLLHVHHRNGVKQDNAYTNLKAVCKACHCEEEFHTHMVLTPDEAQLIARLRRER